jgi:hypothetical protein
LPSLACAETALCTDDLSTSITNTADHQEHDNKKDDCGTTCDCSCCVHMVSLNLQAHGVVIEKPFFKNRAISFYHNISLPSNYFGNIWQPPKSA